MGSNLDKFLEAMTHPVILLSLSLVVFLGLAWMALPFSIYGVRRRLDRIIEGLERIQAALDSRPGEGDEPARALFAALREEMARLGPRLREGPPESSRAAYHVRSGAGEEVPLLTLVLGGDRVEAAVPLEAIRRAHPEFPSERFRGYIVSELVGKDPNFTLSLLEEREVRVAIRPGEGDQAALLAAMVREQLLAPLGEERG
ncbi:MAG: hypothetical protein V3V62_05080 [bacterium]